MKNTVIIKGNKYGISIVLNEDIDFSQLLSDLSAKLENAEEFFDSDKQLAVTFEGRVLSNHELDQILDVIKSNSKLNIQYVMEENSDLEATFFDIIQTASATEKQNIPPEQQNIQTEQSEYITEPEENLVEITPSMNYLSGNYFDNNEANIDKSDSNGLFYKGTLRSGQSLEAKDSLVIIGDVNPGASVIAGSNIVVIGALKGSVTAGAKGDKHAFVMALTMEPIQIQIADIIARSSDTKHFSKNKKEDAMIATVVDDQICIELVSKAAIQDINI